MEEAAQARWVWEGSLSDLTALQWSRESGGRLIFEALNLLVTERHWAVLLVAGNIVEFGGRHGFGWSFGSEVWLWIFHNNK